MRVLLIILRLLMGGVFFYAGVLKLAAPQAFADSIASFQLAPVLCINFLALGLPPFEILLGLWLASGWQRRPAAFCAFGLSLIFLVALGSALFRGISVDCGCFGSESNPLMGNKHSALAMVRDFGLASVAGFLYVTALKEKSDSSTS